MTGITGITHWPIKNFATTHCCVLSSKQLHIYIYTHVIIIEFLKNMLSPALFFFCIGEIVKVVDKFVRSQLLN